MKKRIVEIFEEIPIYGAAKVHQQLLEDGFDVSLNTVASYRQQFGFKAVLAVKPVTTTPIEEHKKHSYKLRGLDITHVNQVWSTDITYIKTNDGMVYLAAIIDWYSKAVLSYKISNTMDSSLVMTVLDQALSNHTAPEIFNTDQGSQYTSEIHTKRLKDKGITISMDGKGSAKCERIYLNEYATIAELKADVADYIDFYNNKRSHETLGYQKPMNVYNEGILMVKSMDDAA
ncbi:MAG: IS3 family transposase [Desulfuromonas sp.]|nr:IS3 family transposase [Desulfuromonas sp.]